MPFYQPKIINKNFLSQLHFKHKQKISIACQPTTQQNIFSTLSLPDPSGQSVGMGHCHVGSPGYPHPLNIHPFQRHSSSDHLLLFLDWYPIYTVEYESGTHRLFYYGCSPRPIEYPFLHISSAKKYHYLFLRQLCFAGSLCSLSPE